MLVLRDSQLALLGDGRRERALVAIAAHVERFFPGQCRALGAAGVREAVEHGVARAASHGLVTEREACKYVDLTFVFGRDFDRDEGWASEVFEAGGPGVLDALYERAAYRARDARGIAAPRRRRR